MKIFILEKKLPFKAALFTVMLVLGLCLARLALALTALALLISLVIYQ